ncbi:carboxymuconolactone decarboxylase family protein [Pseudonocardia sp. NPDC046786]|uniref:carboxymuconolactone decarboxylase family protein n=1 Tax=Pseudonocardia sp. NPDC046786 TaxID=3155471 RepID=UPI0034076959
MSRLEPAKRSEIEADDVQQVLQRVFGDRDPAIEPGTATGSPGDWWTVMALEPGIFRLLESRHEWQKSPERALAPHLRELGILRAGWARGSQFVFSQHCKVAREAGLAEDKIAAVPYWQTSTIFTELERIVLAYADDLVLAGGRVPDQRFEQLRGHLSDVEILEFTFITCTYDMSAVLSRALRLEFDDRPEAVAEVPAPERGEE